MAEGSQTPAESPQVTPDQRTWRVLAHASAFIQFLGPPGVVGPLVVWLLKRNDPVVEPHARAALNFQLSLLIYFIGGFIAAVILLFTIIGSLLILLFLLALVVLEMVFALLATLAASRGKLYDYPMSLSLIN